MKAHWKLWLAGVLVVAVLAIGYEMLDSPQHSTHDHHHEHHPQHK